MDPTTLLIAALAVAGYFLFFDKSSGAPTAAPGGYVTPPGGYAAPPGYVAPPGAPPLAPAAPVQRSPAGPGPLLDQMDADINEAAAETDPDKSVAALKLVGLFGVQQVGPSIDRQSRNMSKGLTNGAAKDNTALQAIPTSEAAMHWAAAAAAALFGPLALPLAPMMMAHSAIRTASASDKMKAIGLVRGMYDKYNSAAAKLGHGVGRAVADPWAAAVSAYSTGLGTIIPSQYGKPRASCFDASSNPSMCASVAFALASETDPMRLRALASNVAGAGFPVAANTLLAKADSLG